MASTIIKILFKMQKKYTITLLLILLFISKEVIGQVIQEIDTSFTQKEDEKVSQLVQNNFSLNTRLTSNYIWRDVITYYTAIQPSASYNLGNSGFSFNFWSNYGTNSKTNDLEISTTVSYNHSLSDQSSIFLGYVHYLAPILDISNSESNTNFSEVMLGISFPFYSLNISQTNFFSSAGELYSNLGVGKQFRIGKSQQFTATTSLGYRARAIPTKNNGFRDLVFNLSYPIQTKYVTFNLYASSTHVLRSKTDAYQVGIDFTFK